MWSLFSQRHRQNSSPVVEFKVQARATRRQRRTFFGAESLESRTLLSATGSDSTLDTATAIDVSNNLPSEGADVVLIGDIESRSSAASSESADHSPIFVPGELDLSLGMSDGVFASMAQPPSANRTPSASSPSPDFGSLLFDRTTFDDSLPTVEVRIAETGQIVSVGASSVQDANGLSISDSSSPTTYLRTTDADGRMTSRLVFITRTSRPAPLAEQQSAMTTQRVIVAESELLEESVAEELASRADLHDFETALDSNSLENVTPTSEPEFSPLSLAAATRTRWVNSARAIATPERSDREADSVSNRDTVRTTAEDDSESAESIAVPIFDSTTRNVLLSVCLLGSLARATARQRRRQKIALAK